MNSKNYPADLSYFRLLLVDFLRESHPHLLDDEKFIAARNQAAIDIYAEIIKNGGNPLEAEHWANETLFAGLHFSIHDTLKNILWNEFSREVPENAAPFFAIRFLPECESVFAKYSLSDDFAYEPEYDLLYTELTGAIALYLESHELQ
ncbi:MAG: DUF1896 domain-containing protein [Dysgonamonadaceae bacterium]|jgi:hypothetical protein|nr:DUF1896 domain-containing protein [Dysgonamonadaceae bacterium]